MASSRVYDILPPPTPLQQTVDRIELTLLVLTDLILKYPMHTPDDVYQTLVFLVRQVSDLQVALINT